MAAVIDSHETLGSTRKACRSAEERETQPEAAPEDICTTRPEEISSGTKASSTRFGPRTFTFSMSATAPVVQSLECVQQ
eukprot:scaffold4953_cov62-Phaeocystis_antarctica.AAC.2